LNKLAQTWILDYIAGFLIFVFLLFISVNLFKSVDARSDYAVVSREVDVASSSLLSAGFPRDWNVSFVSFPGLTTDDRLDLSKLAEFDSLGYERSKSLLRITGEYLFYFENASGIMEVGGECVRGFVDFKSCSRPDFSLYHSDRAWAERIVVLDSQIVSLIMVVWR
jgi:hypothetical protein